eukprot:GEMP01075371.1.p2 GENE.GEMP01075371.1~~GEMP01075371.1.p2  ORF type:complete len:167 (+),score=29.86 GEMP01075371.1:305-805(+)
MLEKIVGCFCGASAMRKVSVPAGMVDSEGWMQSQVRDTSTLELLKYDGEKMRRADGVGSAIPPKRIRGSAREASSETATSSSTTIRQMEKDHISSAREMTTFSPEGLRATDWQKAVLDGMDREIACTADSEIARTTERENTAPGRMNREIVRKTKRKNTAPGKIGR